MQKHESLREWVGRKNVEEKNVVTAAAASSLEILEALASAPVFASLAPVERRSLAAATRVVQLGAQQLLWAQGQPAEHLGLVLHGRLKVGRALRHREMIIDVVGPGDLVGEVALGLRGSYQFDVRCLRRARVLLVPARSLRAVFERHPQGVVALASELAQQVVKLTRQLETLSAGDVQQRLARVLVSLVDRFGVDFPGGTLVPVRLRREDLASLAATTIESTSRRLSAWKVEGIVVPQPAGYLVRDLPALRRLIEV